MKYTILVNSCDSYSDLWYPFFLLLKKYWVGEMPRIILNTETKDYSFVGLDIDCPHINKKDSMWYGRRIKYCLSQIDTPYVLSVLDDFFLRKPVDTDQLRVLISYLDDNPNIACFNFENSLSGEKSERYIGYQTLPPIADYKLNMQAAMWRTADLYRLWKNRENPWTWEAFGNKRTYNTKREFYFLAKGEEPPFFYGKKDGPTWGVVHGRWAEADMVPFFKKHGIDIDFQKRGFYSVDRVEKATNGDNRFKRYLEQTKQMLYYAGFRYTVNCLFYSIIMRRVMKINGTPNDMDYDQYLAAKNNKKDKEGI